MFVFVLFADGNSEDKAAFVSTARLKGTLVYAMVSFPAAD